MRRALLLLVLALAGCSRIEVAEDSHVRCWRINEGWIAQPWNCEVKRP